MADISYTPTTWADGSEGGTPIDAAKLNNIESGISDAVAAIGPNDTTADGTLKAQIDALGESVSSLNGTVVHGTAQAGLQETYNGVLYRFLIRNAGEIKLFKSTNGGTDWELVRTL